MNIAIIGTGNVGSALAQKWAQQGHQIHLGVRDQQNFKGRELLKEARLSLHSIPEAVQASEVIVLATPAMAALSVCESLGATEGKIIIDTMNIVGGRGPEGYKSTAQAIVDHTSGAAVIKCFNTTGFNNMRDAQYGEEVLDAFMAGDDAEAKATVRQLALDAGFAECYDVGDSSQFALMEQFARFWINLAMRQGLGREIGFKLLKR